MPFKSKAQRRKFAQLLVEGKISDETYEEWNRSTGEKALPERLGAASAKTPAQKKPAQKKPAQKKPAKRKPAKKKSGTKKSAGKKRGAKRPAAKKRSAAR
jgi:hypothetical protein